jgi:hypothetical protein
VSWNEDIITAELGKNQNRHQLNDCRRPPPHVLTKVATVAHSWRDGAELMEQRGNLTLRMLMTLQRAGPHAARYGWWRRWLGRARAADESRARDLPRARVTAAAAVVIQIFETILASSAKI